MIHAAAMLAALAAIPPSAWPAAPRTVVVPDTPAARRAALGGPAWLTVRSAAGPAGGGVLVRVFLNTPGATVTTPRSVPGYVGAAAFGHDPADPTDFRFDATAALKRLKAAGLLTSGQRVTATVVVAPLVPDAPDPAARVTFAGITLSQAD